MYVCVCVCVCVCIISLSNIGRNNAVMSNTPSFMLIVAVRTPRLRSLVLHKYYYMHNFPVVPGDMSRLLSSTAVGMTEIIFTWKNNTPSTHRGPKTVVAS